MPDAQPIAEINVKDFAQRKAASPSGLQLLDVREEQELEIAALEGFQNLPLSQFQLWSDTLPTQLDPHAETFVLCHHGMRSAQMCQWLVHQGFTNVNNIAGGIDAYASLVDPSVPRY
jgi:rhodanese-related sulfurtransferase